MTTSSQEKALKDYRKRLRHRGMARFEVLGLQADRNLIRSLARRLAEDSAGAQGLRSSLRQSLTGKPAAKGGILAALRRSPLVGADLDLVRPVVAGRRVDL